MSTSDGAVRALLMDKLKTGYRRPDHIATTVAEMAYLGELCDTLIRMHPTPDEFDHIWQEFKREWQRRYWPPFGELPGRLSKLRQKTAERERAAEAVKPEGGTYASRHRKPERLYHDGEFQAAVTETMDRSSSEDPAEAALNAALARMGMALIERFDDRDRPRDPEADNRVFVPGMENVREERRPGDRWSED